MATINGRVTFVADDYDDYLGLLNAAHNNPKYVVVMEDETELRLIVDLV